MKENKSLEKNDGAPLVDIGLKELVLIVVSVVIGALLSLYINTKYGSSIIKNFSEIQSSTLLDIIGTTTFYFFL